MPGRRVRAGAGVDWVADAWRLFRAAPLMWIIFLVIFFLSQVGLGMVPWIGLFAGNLVAPLLMGGLMLGCRSLETGGDLELEHFLAGFRRNTGLLFAIGVVYALGQVAIMGVGALVAGPSLLLAAMRGDETAMLDAISDGGGLRLVLAGLVAMALMIPLLAAYWFAPALAMLHDVPALDAMKASFAAAFRNFVPMLVYGLVLGALFVVAAIPLGLGLIAWVPLTLATVYTSYRSVFTEPDGETG
jgi:uncharacterized membrane protein